jgi:hypothetical protein
LDGVALTGHSAIERFRGNANTFNFFNPYRLKFDCESIRHRRRISTEQISPTAHVEGKRRLPRECQLQRHWPVMRNMNWPEMDPLRDVRLSRGFHMIAFMAQKWRIRVHGIVSND